MSSAADDLRKVPVLVVSDSGEEGPDVTARLLCLVTKGQFDRTYVNLSNVKAALAVVAGLDAATGGADFREAELGHVKSTGTTGGFVMRPLTVEGGDALVGWCAVGTGRIFVLKGLVFAEGGSADPVDVEVNCSALVTGEGTSTRASSASWWPRPPSCPVPAAWGWGLTRALRWC